MSYYDEICCIAADKFKFNTDLTNKPQRYMEAKEDEKGEFIFTDAKLNSSCEISEIKKVSSNKEVCIRYEGTQKIVDVKQKILED